MKVAFITRFQVVETQGGTERITKSVSEVLSRQYGVECYSLYFNQLTPNKTGYFVLEEKIDNFNREESIRRYLLEWGIDIVISQNEFETIINLRKHLDNKIKFVFVHHFKPGEEAKSLDIRIPLRRLFFSKGDNKIMALKQLVGAPLLLYKQKNFPRLYREMYNSTDQLVLLSKGFIKPFANYAGIETDDDRITVIPNMLSFDSFAEEEDLKKKQKRVLVVSRMDETHKRISKVIRIWQKVMEEPNLTDWELDLVGDGPDIGYYKRMVEKDKIPNITFHGSNDPRSFYKRSPILLMTSESEGWGLTLTEAQQFGCIPIAFDTYESLHDIINDGENGFIIPADEMESFSDKLKHLMTNHTALRPLMVNAIQSAKRFNPEVVGKKWFDMLTKLL